MHMRTSIRFAGALFVSALLMGGFLGITLVRTANETGRATAVGLKIFYPQLSGEQQVNRMAKADAEVH